MSKQASRDSDASHCSSSRDQFARTLNVLESVRDNKRLEQSVMEITDIEEKRAMWIKLSGVRWYLFETDRKASERAAKAMQMLSESLGG